MRILLLWVLLMLSSLTAQAAGVGDSAAGANSGANTILSIDVQGNRYVERETVLAKMHSRVGQQLDRRTLSKDVRRLYKSGFFKDVRFVGRRVARGIHLICKVKEYPLIAKLEMEGNKKFRYKDLKLRMKLKPGAVFNPMNETADRNLLLKGYLKKGYYQVDIHFDATPRKDGRVDLLIRVDEGAVTRISRIYMVGNKAFSDSKLRGAIFSKQTDFMAWLMNKDVFDRKKFGADGQMLQRFYLNHGYLDMRLDSRQVIMSEDKRSFALVFGVHEGAQYHISKVDVQGDLVPDKQTLLDLIEFEPGDEYSIDALQATIKAITERVANEGYAFASVTPMMKRNIEDHTVAITFDVEKGEEIYVERIEISGNEKTDDIVIRRMLKQHEGARYYGRQVNESKEDLLRAPYIEDVRVSLPKSSASDKVIAKVKVKEKRSGSISGGIGYSQQEKVILTAKISESNLFGKGYQASLNGTYGRVTQNVTASFTDPYFLDSNVSASIHGSKVKTNPLTTANYLTNSSAIGVDFSIPITHRLSYGIGYQFSNTNLSGIDPNASLLLRAQEGNNRIGELTQSLVWDSRDRLVAPRSGHIEALRFNVAGPGGDKQFWEASASSSLYLPFDEDELYVLNPSVEASTLGSLRGSNAPLWRRYSLGGIGSLRGFDSYGVSLRDAATGDAVGGDKMVRGSINMFVPIPMIDTPNLRGVLFADTGTVWGLPDKAQVPGAGGTLIVNGPTKFAFSDLRYSAGFGLEWISPIGPIGLMWSYALKKQPGDVPRVFEFMLGSSF